MKLSGSDLMAGYRKDVSAGRAQPGSIQECHPVLWPLGERESQAGRLHCNAAACRSHDEDALSQQLKVDLKQTGAAVAVAVL
jgi:hypothetical protein